MNPLSPIRRLAALLPLALLLLLANNAAAADVYEASWNGGQLTATANADFTEATIESVSVSFGECGTQPGVATCTWEARAILYSHDDRCNPSTPEEQVVWDSGPQSGNGAVTGGPASFALEGCRGQTLGFELSRQQTYEGSPPPWIELESGSSWPLFTFGYHPFEEAEQRIVTANPPASPALLPSMPHDLTVAPDCRSLTIGNAGYRFVFRHVSCRRASDLATMRHVSGGAPSGYHCRNGASGGGVCWRIGHPEKYLEWRLPGSKPTPRPRS